MKSFMAVTAALFLAAVGSAHGQPAAIPKTQEFVATAAVSDLMEIETSKLALMKADNPKSKQFAQKMIDDHTETSKELKALVNGGKVKATIPTSWDKAQQTQLDAMSSLKSADFTKQYTAMQLAAHKDAVSLFERYARGGENADLKAFAAKHLPHLREHLKMAETLDK